MKTTLDIPDDLYRQVKARSALEGRPLRSVAVQLFQRWLDDGPAPAHHSAPAVDDKPTRFDRAPWVTITKPYIRPGMSHDFGDMQAAIAKGWTTEITDKLNLTSRGS